MMRGKKEINKQQHHTDFYSSDYLIVRRGQEFQVKISFNRPYKPAEDKFALEFVIGEQSTQGLIGSWYKLLILDHVVSPVHIFVAVFANIFSNVPLQSCQMN